MRLLREHLSEEGRERVGELFDAAVVKRGLINVKLAEIAGVGEQVPSRLRHGLPDNMSFITVFRLLTSVDIDIYHAAEEAGLMDEVRERVKNDPKGYPTMKRIVEGKSTDPVDQLIEKVPPENRAMARNLICNLLEQMGYKK